MVGKLLDKGYNLWYSEDVDMDVKELREKLGLTQEQLAQKVGVSFKTVNRWENGKSKPSPLARKMLNGLIN